MAAGLAAEPEKKSANLRARRVQDRIGVNGSGIRVEIRCHFAARNYLKTALFRASGCISIQKAKKLAEPVFKPLNEC